VIPYLLPGPIDLANLAGVWAAALVLLLWGRALTFGHGAPEIQIISGWGGLAIVLTVWGAATPLPMAWPAYAIVGVAVASLILPGIRPDRNDWAAIWQAGVLSLPLWAIMLTARPSQPDTFINLLPNAAYLFDHGMFPADGRPPSFSFLPGAPYNLQFWAFLAGLPLPNPAPAAMAHINVLLHLLAGLLLARVVQWGAAEREAAPGWGATALGLLLAIALNPGFVPRIHFASYGETGIAVGLGFAGWIAARGLDKVAERQSIGREIWALALVLAALVNIKQESVAFVAALGAGIAAIGLCDRRVRFWRSLRLFVPAFVPAAALYLLWRWYVLGQVPGGELKLQPFDQWRWDLLPQIATHMAGVAAEKGLYFGCLALAVILLVIGLIRRGFDLGTRLLSLLAVSFVVYNGFLVFTYVAHFAANMGADAHSYFRYNTHLTILMVIAIATAVRIELARREGPPAHWWRRLGAAAAVLLILALPIGFAKRLRFDLVMPQPLVWALGHDAAGFIGPDDKLALVAPGDNGSVATMMENVLRFTPPRRTGIQLRVERGSDGAALKALAESGVDKVLITCTPEAIGEVPQHRAVLLKAEDGELRPLAVWRYPAADATRWTPVLAPEPLCRSSQ